MNSRVDTTTADWQRLDSAHYLHPFTDFKALAAQGRAHHHARRRRVHLHVRGRKDPRRHVRPVVRGARLRAQGTRRTRRTGRCSNCLTTTASSRAARTPAIELARILTEVTPPQFNHVFYTGSGSEANDTMIRLVRRYWQLLGKPERNVIISRWNGYHGSTIAGASLGGMKPMHEQLGPDGALPGIVHINQPYWFGEGGDLTPAEFGLARARELEAEDPRNRAGTGRGLHRRTGAGRRRPGDPAGDLLAGDPAHRRQVRHPVRLRRGDLRLRPHRPVVRLRTLRHAPRLHDHGQGPVSRLSTNRRPDGGRPGGPKYSSTRAASSFMVSPIPATRPPAPWRSPTWRSSGANASSSGSGTRRRPI